MGDSPQEGARLSERHVGRERESNEAEGASLRAVRLVAVGSRNPVKIAAARAVLVPLVAADARVEGVAVASTVPDQPWGDEETIRGAAARARAAREALDADLGVGLEGGVVEDRDSGEVRSCAWAVVVGRDGRTGTGGSLAFPLPPSVANAVRAGQELGHAMDALTGASNTKHGAGAVGVLTAGLIDRQRAYEVLVVYALVPWLGEEYWE